MKSRPVLSPSGFSYLICCAAQRGGAAPIFADEARLRRGLSLRPMAWKTDATLLAKRELVDLAVSASETWLTELGNVELAALVKRYYPSSIPFFEESLSFHT